MLTIKVFHPTGNQLLTCFSATLSLRFKGIKHFVLRLVAKRLRRYDIPDETHTVAEEIVVCARLAIAEVDDPSVLVLVLVLVLRGRPVVGNVER